MSNVHSKIEIVLLEGSDPEFESERRSQTHGIHQNDFSNPILAGSFSLAETVKSSAREVRQAKLQLNAIRSAQGSSLEKRLVLRSCRALAELAAECTGIKVRDLNEATFQEVKTDVRTSLQIKGESGIINSQPNSQSEAGFAQTPKFLMLGEALVF